MGAGKNKGLNSNLGLCMCIHEQNRKQQFAMVDPVYEISKLILFLFRSEILLLFHMWLSSFIVFYDFVVFIYVSFYICLLSVCPFSKKERKGSHGWQEPPLPRPTPNTPKKTPCCVARATNTDFSRLHRDKEVFFKRGPGWGECNMLMCEL